MPAAVTMPTAMVAMTIAVAVPMTIAVPMATAPAMTVSPAVAPATPTSAPAAELEECRPGEVSAGMGGQRTCRARGGRLRKCRSRAEDQRDGGNRCDLMMLQYSFHGRLPISN